MATIRRPVGLLVDGKKYDAPSKTGTASPSGVFRSLRTLRRRRIVVGFLALCLIYFFVKNIPTDVPPVSQRVDPRYGPLRPGAVPQGPDVVVGNAAESQSYTGPIKFHYLAASLRESSFTQDPKSHVLFALSNLKSASHIVIAACGMAQQNRTRVHVALLGRTVVPVKEVLLVNGLSESDCPVNWHDGRPDYPVQSTTERMLYSVGAAFRHIHTALRLQAAFIDDNMREDDFFLSGMKSTAPNLGVPLIPLPVNERESLPWVLSLDGLSLNIWDKVQIDIIIRAVAESSGSLLRLLRSIKKADYTGLSYPRLIIELPAKTDPFLLERLNRFEWPPGAPASESKLILRRYVDGKRLTPALASIRTVESFYPIESSGSHVMVLSANAELSPNYYQFLMFILLEFKYGAKMSAISRSLLGISLDLPSQNLKSKGPTSPAPSISEPMLLWQAPTADAGLYFGDKWAEMHQFLSSRLSADPELLQTVPKDVVMSRKQPAWLHVALEMMQAQGYYMLYPIQGEKGPSLVTIHQELGQGLEEYIDSDSKEEATLGETAKGSISDGGILTADGQGGQRESVRPMVSSSSFASILGLNAGDGEILAWPDARQLPLFSYDSDRVTWADSESRSATYAETFALSVGGCASLEDLEDARAGTIDALFCEHATS